MPAVHLAEAAPFCYARDTERGPSEETEMTETEDMRVIPLLVTRSGTVHEADFQIRDMTHCTGTYPQGEQTTGPASRVTCRRCLRRMVTG